MSFLLHLYWIVSILLDQYFSRYFRSIPFKSSVSIICFNTSNGWYIQKANRSSIWHLSLSHMFKKREHEIWNERIISGAQSFFEATTLLVSAKYVIMWCYSIKWAELYENFQTVEVLINIYCIIYFKGVDKFCKTEIWLFCPWSKNGNGKILCLCI